MRQLMKQILDSTKEKLYEYSNDLIDAALDISLVVMAVLSISGCSVTPSEPVEPAVYHPTWPQPYEVCDVEWKVFIIEEEPFVALSFDDNLEFANCSIDLIRYIRELNMKFCHYRPEGDERCVYKTNEEE